jgi:hypothetical protein
VPLLLLLLQLLDALETRLELMLAALHRRLLFLGSTVKLLGFLTPWVALVWCCVL